MIWFDYCATRCQIFVCKAMKVYSFADVSIDGAVVNCFWYHRKYVNKFSSASCLSNLVTLYKHLYKHVKSYKGFPVLVVF